MQSKYLPLLIVSLLPLGNAHSDKLHQLTGDAQTATVEISPQPAGRRLITLPELEFQVHVDAICRGNSSAESLSISIADTIETHYVSTSNVKKSGDLVVDTTIKVTTGQLAPIPIDGFCTSDKDDANAAETIATQELLFPAAFAATISLRCSTGSSQSVDYVSVPLDIRLVCKPNAASVDARSATGNNE